MECQITGTTRILGLIADPVAQTRSPLMANEFLSERGRFGDFVLVPMQVPREALAAAIGGLRRMENFAGAIVSMPHKSAVVELLDVVTTEVRLVGAANVIRRDSDGSLAGTMLDGEGFVAGMRRAGHDVKDAACLLAGAGGAAAAIAIALARHGCRSLTIQNRTASKAELLAARVRKAFPETDVRSTVDGDQSFELLVNATSLGMRDDDPLPVPLEIIQRTKIVADCVLAREITPLLDAARQNGCIIQTGRPMLAAQMHLMLLFMGVER